MSPKLYREFIHPYYKNLVQSLKKRGTKVIFHSDGNIMPIINDILDWGIDGLHPIQPGVMDISQVKRDYGNRIAVVGGVDVAGLLPFGSEEDVERAVIDVIGHVSPGGGHILGSSNSLHSYVPDMDKYVKNILRYIETAHKFGTYPIRNLGPSLR
jgi:uroporphyrinogen decarboxylase